MRFTSLSLLMACTLSACVGLKSGAVDVGGGEPSLPSSPDSGTSSGTSGASGSSSGVTDADVEDTSVIPARDAGVDASSDAGSDASSDAGSDAGDGSTSSADAAIRMSNDPFDAASCVGTAIDRPTAIALLGAGRAQTQLSITVPLSSRTRSCNPVTGCGPWTTPTQYAPLRYMAPVGASDNANYPFPFNVSLWVFVPYPTTNLMLAIEETSGRLRIDGTVCDGCSPSGVKFQLGSSTTTDTALYINYPRWDHTTGGFRRQYDWAAQEVGTSTLTATEHCARFTALSTDQQTELAALFRY